MDGEFEDEPDHYNVYLFNLKTSKPVRLCIFCNKYKTRLSSLIRNVHKNEPQIIKLIKMPLKEANKELAKIRREGIYLQNMNSSNKISDRKLKSSQPKMCKNCNSFFSNEYMRKHQRNCHPRKSESSFSSYNLNDHDSSFTTDVVSKFLDDEIGKFCINDDTLYNIGKFMWEKHKQKFDENQ